MTEAPLLIIPGKTLEMEQIQLQTEFKKLETLWSKKRPNAEEATLLTITQLKGGETILFLPNDAIYGVIDRAGAVGQHDLGFQLNGKPRGYPLIHVWKPKL